MILTTLQARLDDFVCAVCERISMKGVSELHRSELLLSLYPLHLPDFHAAYSHQSAIEKGWALFWESNLRHEALAASRNIQLLEANTALAISEKCTVI